LYSFNGFLLETAERVLLRSGQPIPVPPKVLDVLVELVENHGHIVEKEQLLQRVWTDTFVEESAIAQSIFTLRKLLGDTPDGHAYIETVPRRGYRFVAPVEELKDEPIVQIKVPEEATLLAQPRFRYWRIAAIGLAVVLIVAGFFAWPREARRVNAHSGKIMLAVLPFSNLSNDPQQEYFSNGLTEEMITQLGDLEPNRLGVIARTSAMQYKDTKKDAREIGRELGVDYILEGSVRREGDQVRITAQLIQVEDQTHLWARDYDRGLRNILALQSDVAGAIAREIKLKLTPEERSRLASPPSLDPQAYELYLKGRYFWNKRNEDGFVKAIDYFGQAIGRDPKYAQAYAGLADAYALIGSMANLELPRAEAMTRAKAAALQALHLDDSLAEAHTSLAFVEMHYEWDWPGSEKEFKRALELNPNYATAHQWYAVWLMAQGKTPAALEEERRAQEADPLSVIIKTDTAQLLVYAGDFDKAAQQAQRALEIAPDFPLAHIFLGEAYVGKQSYPAAITEFQKALAISKGDAGALSELARTYALGGQRDKSEAILAILQKKLQNARDRGELAIQVAALDTALGKDTQAFELLEEAYQNRVGSLILLNTTPVYQSLRPDPRFNDLIRRVGLPRIMEHQQPSTH
jgi:TolB-like protein/DNA-binding winged helix-turn-helix (wHTH) protein/Tfp pilus assembly protein PilF